MEQQYSSTLLNRAVDEFAKLPGIGRKTALRLSLHLLRLEPASVEGFAAALTDLVHQVKRCHICHNISDSDTCEICGNPMRDRSILCVVENIQDVMAIENTGQYHGLYHVLGGIISPIEGIGPGDLEVDSLMKRAEEDEEVSEVIIALSPTLEGDTTGFYLYRRLSYIPRLTITTLSRGISVNDEIQYADEATLGRSIVNRIPFNS